MTKTVKGYVYIHGAGGLLAEAIRMCKEVRKEINNSRLNSKQDNQGDKELLICNNNFVLVEGYLGRHKLYNFLN